MTKRITLGSGDPRRLFVGGLHGDEWMHTSALLESLDAPGAGTLVIIPKLTDRAYVSTLDARYYEGYGRDLVAAIEEIRPAIYLELHSYRDFYGLTDSRRIDKKRRSCLCRTRRGGSHRFDLADSQEKMLFCARFLRVV